MSSNSGHGARPILATLLLFAGASLSGCGTGGMAFDDEYTPQAADERYPISVVAAPVKAGVKPQADALSAEQKDSVVGFAIEAKRTARSKVMIKYPTGNRNSRKVAQQMAEIMVSNGLPKEMIKIGSYAGGQGQPILMSFERKVAVTKECGDWSVNLANTASQDPYPNFGCSVRHNMAAMVADPEDFERPRPSSPVHAGNRYAVLQVYTANKTAGDYFTLDGSGTGGGGN